MPRTGSPSLKNRTCIWCGARPEFTLLLRRFREQSFRYAVRYDLCGWCANETIERVAKLLSPTDSYLAKLLGVTGGPS